MSEQTGRLISRLRDRLERATQRLAWAELTYGITIVVGTVTTLWLFSVLLEARLWLGPSIRTALVTAMTLLGTGLCIHYVVEPLGRLLGLLSGPPPEDVARRVGQHYPDVGDRLVNLLQIAEGKRSRAPAPFVDEAVEHLATNVDERSFEAIEDFGQTREALRLASLPVVGILAFLLLAPASFVGASERLLAPRTSFEQPAPFELSVVPGHVRVVQGDSLSIRLHTSPTGPSRMVFERRDASDASSQRRTLQADNAGRFRHTIPAVRSSFEYRFQSSGTREVSTSWYTVDVERRPLVRQLQVGVTPPAYTGHTPRQLQPNVGDVSALPGARVHVAASLGGTTTDSASLVFENQPDQALSVQGDSASGTFAVHVEDTYHVSLKSLAGIPNRDPIEYRVSLQADAHPTASFLRPEGSTEVGADLIQPLRVRLSDDYGFSEAKLFYRVEKQRFGEGTKSFKSIPLSLSSANQSRQEISHEWLLAQESGLDPEPGEVIAYYVRVWDNDTVNGPKSGRTTTQRLRRPSQEEQYEELHKTQDETSGKIDRLRQRSDSVRQQFRHLKEELRRTREADWDDRRQLQRVREQQESVEKGLEELSETVEKMNRQMRENGLSSPETMEKFEELRRVIDEINSPELREALDELKDAMQAGDLRKMQDAMENVDMNEEDYREQLDRTLSLFKQLKAQQQLEELARRAENLGQLQERLREQIEKRKTTGDEDGSVRDGQTENQPPEAETSSSDDDQSEGNRTEGESDDSPSEASSDERTGSTTEDQKGGPYEDLASEQDQAAERMQQLQDQLEETTRELGEVPRAPQKDLQELHQQLQQQELPEQMRKNSEQLRQNEAGDAQEGQKNMQQALENAQQRLDEMKSRMQGQQKQIEVNGLRSALENTLRLSKNQESLRTEIETLSREGPTLRKFAREQNTLVSGLQSVTDSLHSLARQIPEMSHEVREKSGNALRAMQTATDALSEQNSGTATGHQKTSMRHLNELALLLSNLLDQLQNQQGQGSAMSMQQMIQSLQEMSGNQQQLNKEIQEHLNEVQGNRLSNEQSKRRKELAREQRRLKNELEDMNVGSEAQEQLMGDLEKIAEQMEKSAQELEQGRPSRELIERQQQILTRLLNAQSSMRTQGKKEERRGEEAQNEYEEFRPGDLPSTDDVDKLHRDLIRALEMGYSSDYEELIKRYFELLEERE